MRFATILFTIGIAASSTSSASLVVRVTVPACYDDCVATVAESGGTGPCSSTDIKCLCDNPTYVSETTTCVENTCKGSDLGDAISLGISVCLAAGATGTGTFSAPTATGTGAPSALAANPTSSSAPATISGLKAAAGVHNANLNSFMGLAALGLVTLAIY